MSQFGQRHPLPTLGLVAAAWALGALAGACSEDPPAASDPDPGPAEVALGKRLFRETRFAQYFAARAEGDMNRRLTDGDPALASVATPGGPVPGPYRGQSINCASCHLSDELGSGGRGASDLRAFADFSARSPVPDRGDGRATTTRNAATLIDALVPEAPAVFLHHDGEHATAEDLVRGSLTGRNFGWLPPERAQATAHLANVVRRDDGSDALATRHGRLPYRVALLGTAEEIPPGLRLPESFRIDVAAATDEQILAAVARLVTAFVAHQRLARDEQGAYRGSPYDRFLAQNDLPSRPAPGEDVLDYGRRLYERVVNLIAPAYVPAQPGRSSGFGALELAGLVTFLGKPGETPTGPPGIWACSTCHPPPHFTDFRFHNTGVTEVEYDRIHGAGSFAALDIPTLAQRRMDPTSFLPPTDRIPAGTSRFRAVPDKEHPGRTDLGVWNVILNDDVPAVQPALQAMLCPTVTDAQGNCIHEDLLTRAIGAFKTRGLRNLGRSGPYFHNGQADTFEAVVTHYAVVSLAVKNLSLRSGAEALEWLSLSSGDIPTLAAFLRSLDEN